MTEFGLGFTSGILATIVLAVWIQFRSEKAKRLAIAREIGRINERQVNGMSSLAPLGILRAVSATPAPGSFVHPCNLCAFEAIGESSVASAQALVAHCIAEHQGRMHPAPTIRQSLVPKGGIRKGGLH